MYMYIRSSSYSKHILKISRHKLILKMLYEVCMNVHDKGTKKSLTFGIGTSNLVKVVRVSNASKFKQFTKQPLLSRMSSTWANILFICVKRLLQTAAAGKRESLVTLLFSTIYRVFAKDKLPTTREEGASC